MVFNLEVIRLTGKTVVYNRITGIAGGGLLYETTITSEQGPDLALVDRYKEFYKAEPKVGGLPRILE